MDNNTSWLVASALVICWSAISVVYWSWWVAKRPGKELVVDLGNALPPFAILSLLLSFALVPASSPVSVVFMWLHHMSILMLLAFLLLAELFQLIAYLHFKNGNDRDAAGAYRSLWSLTLIAPAPIALTIFLTGLRLMYQKPPDSIQIPGQEVSLSAMWLQTIVISFGLFFFDGILGFTPAVKRIYRNVIENSPLTWREAQSTSETALFFIHCISWIGVLLVAVIHPLGRTHLSAPLEWVQDKVAVVQHLLGGKSPGWAEVITAVLLYALVGAFVFGARQIGAAMRPTSE